MVLIVENHQGSLRCRALHSLRHLYYCVLPYVHPPHHPNAHHQYFIRSCSRCLHGRVARHKICVSMYASQMLMTLRRVLMSFRELRPWVWCFRRCEFPVIEYTLIDSFWLAIFFLRIWALWDRNLWLAILLSTIFGGGLICAAAICMYWETTVHRTFSCPWNQSREANDISIVSPVAYQSQIEQYDLSFSACGITASRLITGAVKLVVRRTCFPSRLGY